MSFDFVLPKVARRFSAGKPVTKITKSHQGRQNAFGNSFEMIHGILAALRQFAWQEGYGAVTISDSFIPDGTPDVSTMAVPALKHWVIARDNQSCRTASAKAMPD
jgi:hypothetical protein